MDYKSEKEKLSLSSLGLKPGKLRLKPGAIPSKFPYDKLEVHSSHLGAYDKRRRQELRFMVILPASDFAHGNRQGELGMLCTFDRQMNFSIDAVIRCNFLSSMQRNVEKCCCWSCLGEMLHRAMRSEQLMAICAAKIWENALLARGNGKNCVASCWRGVTL